MFERLILAGIIAALGVAGWILYNRAIVHGLAAKTFHDPLLAGVALDIPAIVYFTTPFCVPCRTQQKPALVQLEHDLQGAIQVIQVDATENPEAADRWQVFGAPTTFVLDRQHKPRHVNRGVATVEILKRQLASID